MHGLFCEVFLFEKFEFSLETPTSEFMLTWAFVHDRGSIIADFQVQKCEAVFVTSRYKYTVSFHSRKGSM